MTEPTLSSGAPSEAPTFDALPLGADVRRAIDAMGYRHPTPVQRAVFEPAAEGRNLVVQARTGTGKTAAFGIPIVDRVVRPSAKTVQALVLCPTRELALQVAREIEQLGRFRGIKVVAIYGGASMTKQIEAIDAGGQIVVGTPGRILDHLRQKTLDPSAIRVLVLDEADEMLSMGFARELNAILEALPKSRQGLFFSATLPPDIERMAHSHLRNAELITLSSDQVGALEIVHYVYVLRGGEKIGQLVHILEVEDPESAIVFCNTRDETLRVADGLKARGFDADWLNGDLPQADRERVMNATKEGKLRFLVATDVAARGIDISHLTHVINYDFPETAEQYVHRTGRTGRAGRTGTAISIVGPKDIGNLYLLRLTYKIRPIEKQLPSAGELKTRAEMDLVQLFVDAFAARRADPDDLSLARRLLTHEDGERIVAGLLRDHLGAKGGDAPAEAAEARRARNPSPDSAAGGHIPPPSRDDRPPGRSEPAAPRRQQGEGGGRERPQRERGRDAARAAAVAAAPGGGPSSHGRAQTSNFRWTPPSEADDDEPILEAPPTADTPQHAPADAYVQLFVNVGAREGLRPADLQKLLEAQEIGQGDIAGIRVRDRMTFVRIRKGLIDRAIAALSGQVIGGRTVVAELARGHGSG